MSFDRAALAAALASHDKVARVVVAEAAGSAPREPGAAMLVWADGQAGTIGGGALEWSAAARARRLLGQGRGTRIDRMPLGPALGQCCGGAVVLVTEVFDARTLPEEGAPLAVRRIDGPEAEPLAVSRLRAAARGGSPVTPQLVQGWMVEPPSPPRTDLWIWGAGHVGRALVGVLAPLPGMAITWIDTAPERFPDAVPDPVVPLVAARPAALVPHAPPRAHHLVLTYSHALDLDLCHALLSHAFASAGLIGSATKWARFRKRLAALGHGPDQIARITCPIGDPSLGKHPQTIAVGVAAALLRFKGASDAVRDGTG